MSLLILGKLYAYKELSFLNSSCFFWDFQVIVNKSRAQCRACLRKIPVHINDLEKIPLVSEEIKVMLRSNPNLFPGIDAPYCYLSRIEDSFAELTLGCNLRNMVIFLVHS